PTPGSGRPPPGRTEAPKTMTHSRAAANDERTASAEAPPSHDRHLAEWHAAWCVLTTGWSASAASVAVEALDDFLESADGPAAERAADLTAFLVGFSESDKQPTPPQWRRIEQLAALLRASVPEQAIAPAGAAD